MDQAPYFASPFKEVGIPLNPKIYRKIVAHIPIKQA